MGILLLKFAIDYYTVLFFSIILICSSVLWSVYGWAFMPAFIYSFIFWNIGLRGILACIANWISAFADPIAESYGWEKGQSYQKEIASADGAFGILGLLSPLFSFDFSLATIFGFCICTILSEWSGIKELKEQIMQNKNDASTSIKIGMGIDFILSTILLVITIIYWLNINYV